MMLENDRGSLAFPGGLVEEMESLEDALRREVLEETGLEVRVGKLFHAVKYVHPLGRENVGLYFHAELAGGDVRLGREKESKFIALKWLPREALPEWARKVIENF